MRYLHPVAASEKFIAKGVYRFYEGETLLPKTQAWTRHRLAGDTILTRIDYEGESAGLTTLVEALADETGQVERLSIRQWDRSPNATYRSVRANYFVFANEIHATRTYDDRPTDEAVFSLPLHGYLHPPFHVFMPLLMVKSALPFMPYWFIGDSLGHLWSNEHIDKPLKIDTVSQAPAIVYHFPDSTAIFDKYMILQEYRHKSELVKLTEYAHI